MASFANDGLTRNQRYEFRLMAAHPEIVEQVIAESTDEQPASRRKVMAAIRRSMGAERSASMAAASRHLRASLDEVVGLGLLTPEEAEDIQSTVDARRT